MKLSRELIFFTALIGTVVSAAGLYWSQRQVGHLAAADLDFTRARGIRRAAVDEATACIAGLKGHLTEVEWRVTAPTSYEEWSRRQSEARAAIMTLRQRIADLEPAAAFPVAPLPQLTAAWLQNRSVSGALLAEWMNYEQHGSGLTPASQDLAAHTLLPLVADQLEPAFGELVAAERLDADHKAAALPELAATARTARLVFIVALVALAVLLVSTLLPKRRHRPILPLTPPPPPAPAKKRETPPPSASNFEEAAATMAPGAPKILLAESDAAHGDVLALLLTNAGYAVIGCDNGTVALDAIRAIPFNLLLLDQQLPGKSGLEILREARRLNPTLPAVLLTAPDESQRIAASSPRPTEVVTKPVNPRMLLWTVSEILFPGENRVSRDYSPYVPEPDDEAEPASEIPADERPRPPRRVPEPEQIRAPVVVPLPPRPAPVPRPLPSPPPAPAPTPPLPPPPAPPPAPLSAPPSRVAPEPPAPAAEPVAPAETGVTGVTDGSASPLTPGAPRKKMVRRRILPSEESEGR